LERLMVRSAQKPEQVWRPGLGLAAIIRENHLSALKSGGRTLLHKRCGVVRAVPGCRRNRNTRVLGHQDLKGDNMAAMKPRTGDGPLEVTKEGRGIVMRVPLEGGGRLVVEMTKDEANELSEALKSATG
jgi:hypothetical protein